MLKINNEDWRKFRLWVVVLRVVLMGMPALLVMVAEWLYNTFGSLLLWLDRKLPDPKKLDV